MSGGRRGVRAVGVVLGVGAFVGVLWWMTLRQQGVQCRVCMDLGGRMQCSTVSAKSRDEAMEAAVGTACGTLSTSVTNELACRRETPRSVQCTP